VVTICCPWTDEEVAMTTTSASGFFSTPSMIVPVRTPAPD
jgi:hypothetical protein